MVDMRLGFLWKTGEPKFKNNFEMAHRRLQTLEKSLMNKGSEVATGYNKIIEDYVEELCSQSAFDK